MTDRTEPEQGGPFRADPGKVGQAVTKGDLANLIGAVGLVLSQNLAATSDILRGDSTEAREEVKRGLDYLKQLVDECRAFLGPDGTAG